MAIIDVITFNGEYDLFELRYKILRDYVDEFIVVEFDKTFSGKDKSPYFLRDYPICLKKVKYCLLWERDYEKYKGLAESSPNTTGAEHWKMEFMQKESIKDCLTHLKDEDIVFVGDCDEIWYPQAEVNHFYTEPFKAKLLVYSYFLNQRSNEEFWGTLSGQYKHIKNQCLNHLRTYAPKIDGHRGWHFTNMGGVDEVRRKLDDSYTNESYNTPEVQAKLEERHGNTDYLGRKFTFTLDESDWPQYLKDNREKYKHLLK